jgi:hypothetical protein
MEKATRTWPLSAAVTAVLRDVDEQPGVVVRLTLKELVLRRAWRLERRTDRSGLLGRPKEVVVIVPGDRPAPDLVPLPVADRVLREVVGPHGIELSVAVRRLMKRTAGGEQLRDAARDELAARGLAEVERRKRFGLVPRTDVRLTPTGESWLRDSLDREDHLDEALRGRRPEPAAEALALGGLVLLLSPGPLEELDAAMARLRTAPQLAAGPAPVGGGDDEDHLADAGALDFADLDALNAVDASFEAAVDSGLSDGGGFDGGGGGGGDAGGGGG